MNETIIYIDRSDVHDGQLDALTAGICQLAAVAERLEPQLISYGFYVDAAAHRMTVVVVHPDSESLEVHMEILAAEFRKLAPFLTLRSIEVFGRVSGKAVRLLLAGCVFLPLRTSYPPFGRCPPNRIKSSPRWAAGGGSARRPR